MGMGYMEHVEFTPEESANLRGKESRMVQAVRRFSARMDEAFPPQVWLKGGKAEFRMPFERNGYDETQPDAILFWRDSGQTEFLVVT